MDLKGVHVIEADFLIQEALELVRAGYHNTAMNYLTKVIDANPRNSKACTLLGYVHDCLGQYEEAIASYDMALQIDPGYTDAWFNKIKTLKKMGKIKEAASCTEMAIGVYCGR
jgi:tetratricopeptide (TPR) repeat protein